ncbi:hypothetical protein [Kribbella sp.]|uniref:hypothetical protein n=1 Tax=Kribbella sp. TaxID=1871183 RepID=UPI002D343603|nr:hypothetical protein [Kribbella sp.]HZX05678.1 hypothetical protein [Kribbella sp.]
MSARVVIWATVDEAAGRAVITGQNHDALVAEIAPRAPWSRAGRGWVLSLVELGDLCCLAQETGAIYRERAVKR